MCFPSDLRNKTHISGGPPLRAGARHMPAGTIRTLRRDAGTVDETYTRTSIWRPGLTPTLGLAVVLILLVALTGLRAAATLGSLRLLAPLSFVLMAVTPWLLLNKEGRREIGLVKANRARDYGFGIIVGGLAAAACFVLGWAMFGDGADNWFVSVASDYGEVPGAANFPIVVLHGVFTIPALIFSPIGEEIFFRGVMLRSFGDRFDPRISNTLQAAAFGLVHLLHHGLAQTESGLTVRPWSGLIWVGLMFGTALIFGIVRLRSGSLYPAMASHAAFNLVMNLTIFAALWPVG